MKKIIIDPGHGGTDPGAMGNGLLEKEMALILAQKTAYYLNTLYTGHEVRLTRTTDVYPTLDGRVNMANRWGADVFVSIHLNSASSTSASGYEDFVYSRKYSTTARLQDIMNRRVGSLYSVNRGKKTNPSLRVLNGTNMDAILTENGFISNKGDMDKMKQVSFQNVVARAHADAIAEFLGLKSKNTVNSSQLYKVQIGAFRNRNNANDLLNKAKQAGFDAFIAVENGLYKVQIGAYSVKDNAVAQLNRAKQAGFDAFIA